MALRIDLNADLGEGMGDDGAMLGVVSSANVACGGHAGGAEEMSALLAAAPPGLVIGAHPGYEDRAGFGRVVVPMSPEALRAMLLRQIEALVAHADRAGRRVRYVKPHGALYNLAARDETVSDCIVSTLKSFDSELILLGLSGSEMARAAHRGGIGFAAEVFADRGYAPDGSLLPRGAPGAVLEDVAVISERMLRALEAGAMPLAEGGALPMTLPLAMDSICLHGDTPGAVRIAQGLRAALEGAGYTIAPFAAPS